jgi:asparagine synthase (glutamine-hydrolysing)
MCGICGIYNFDGHPVNVEILKRMNATLVHRGPDDEGYFINAWRLGGLEAGRPAAFIQTPDTNSANQKNTHGNVGLGHRRLSIIDLSTGQQPIFNEDGSKVIIFNGEIYNFIDLRDKLKKKGHLFKTKTDTEVILHGYEEWGVECVNFLRGMFAIAIWDSEAQRLFLARDRLGIKPLYYSLESSRIIFSSELKAILVDETISRDLDLEALSDYLSLGYIPSPKTIFRNIKKLPAGHILVQDKRKTNIKQYWDISFQQHPDTSEKVFCRLILEKIEEAVRIRLVSDVPLGAFLSGGIDSSIVVAMMARLIESPVVTNSIGFTHEKYSELEFADSVARNFKTDHYKYVVTPDAVDVVNRLSWHFDEPFADSSAIPTYYLSRMARQNVTVALSGDGGDENFAGYRRYYYDRLENQLRTIVPSTFRKNVVGFLARIYPKADWLPQVFRAKTLLTNISVDPLHGYFNSMSHFSHEMKQKAMSTDIKDQLDGYDSVTVFNTHYLKADTDDLLSRIQYIDFKTYLVDDILTKVDRASMANSLEVRVPILDHEFVELVANIPSNLKLNGHTSKYIFKKAAGRLLPDEILKRRKMGFSIPIGEWLKGELKPLLYDTILSKEFGERGLFDTKYIQRLCKQHTSGLRNFAQPLWTLLSLELWARRFL